MGGLKWEEIHQRFTDRFPSQERSVGEPTGTLLHQAKEEDRRGRLGSRGAIAREDAYDKSVLLVTFVKAPVRYETI